MSFATLCLEGRFDADDTYHLAEQVFKNSRDIDSLASGEHGSGRLIWIRQSLQIFMWPVLSSSCKMEATMYTPAGYRMHTHTYKYILLYIYIEYCICIYIYKKCIYIQNSM